MLLWGSCPGSQGYTDRGQGKRPGGESGPLRNRGFILSAKGESKHFSVEILESSVVQDRFMAHTWPTLNPCWLATNDPFGMLHSILKRLTVGKNTGVKYLLLA
jgi:hypothetical protein